MIKTFKRWRKATKIHWNVDKRQGNNHEHLKMIAKATPMAAALSYAGSQMHPLVGAAIGGVLAADIGVHTVKHINDIRKINKRLKSMPNG